MEKRQPTMRKILKFCLTTNKGLVTEFAGRKLGTSPWFKKARSIGEKVVRAQGEKEDFSWERVKIKS